MLWEDFLPKSKVQNQWGLTNINNIADTVMWTSELEVVQQDFFAGKI